LISALFPSARKKCLLYYPPNHKLVGKKTISIRDLAREPIIMKEKGSGTRKLGASAKPLHGIGAFITDMTAHPK